MIRIENLTKRYDNTLAVDDLSFEVQPGEIVGFLGPNGAGKSTTMRILFGLLAPTSGKAWVDGFDVQTQSLLARTRMGYVPEVVPLYDEMTVDGYLDFMAQMRRLPDRRDRVLAVAGMCHLSERLHTHIGKLSHGYRQRVGLAQALIHRPPVLILDEPTTGLDPVQIVEIRNLIRQLAGRHTILLSTHILAEAEQVCDRALIVDRGRLVGQCDLQRTRRGERTLFLRLNNAGPELEQGLTELPGVASLDPVEGADGRYRVVCAAESEPEARIVRLIVQLGGDVLELSSSRTELEQIFMQTVGRGER